MRHYRHTRERLSLSSFIILVFAGVLGMAAVFDMPLARAAMSSQIVPDFPQANGTVDVILPAEDGSVYIGGNYSEIGGVERNSLARILPDKSVDPDFDPNIEDSAVTSLALSSDGSTLYVGGNFDTVNGGVTRNNLAAFDTATGEVTDFDPDANGTVNDITLSSDGSLLYAGGWFNTVNGGEVEREWMAAFNTDDGTATSFDPGPSSPVNAIQLSQDETVIYAGGWVDLISYSTSTGALTDFDPDMDISVNDIALSSDGDTLYIGGSFNEIDTPGGTVTRNGLASFDLTTGTLTDFDPNVDTSGYVYKIALSHDDSTLYATGSFATVNGDVERENIVAVSTLTSEVTDFNPGADGWTDGLALSSDKTHLYVGGNFEIIGGESQAGLAAFHDPDVDNDGLLNTVEREAPNNGDGNNDGTPDHLQRHVASLTNATNGENLTIVVSNECALTGVSTSSEEQLAAQDIGFEYPAGFADFTADCGTIGYAMSVELYFYGASASNATVRKYYPSTDAYSTVNGATISEQTIGGKQVVKAAYTVTDGGQLDTDGQANGFITDPVGLGVGNIHAPNTGLGGRLNIR